jgi:alkylated DNA repair dioxygenase AlkB
MIKPILLPGNGSTCEFPGASLRYFESFFSKKETNRYFKQLKDEILWQQDSITVYGKEYSQPRLTALYANNSLPYSYSGITMHPHRITPLLFEIQNRVQSTINIKFTTVLLNLYRNGKDSNGWHADNEKELGENPAIASVSFGAERFFHLKHKNQKELRLKIPLTSGSLLLMEGETQTHWLHQVAKTSKLVGPRINLTFRKII